MNRLRDTLSHVIADLHRLEKRFAVVGGLAVAARVRPRLTNDIDLAVAVSDDAEAEQLIHALVRSGYRITAAVEQTATGRLATVRLIPPGSMGVVVDLLFSSCGIETETVQSAEPLEVFPGTVAPVASLPHLISMKILSRDDLRRIRDIDDLREMMTIASDDVLQRVEGTLHLIAERGYNRGKDLAADLAQLKSERAAGTS